MSDSKTHAQDPGLEQTALIRELVDLSRFTDGILRTLGSGVVAVDTEGLISYVNPAAETLLGLPARKLHRAPVNEVLITRSGESLFSESFLEQGVGEVDLKLADGGTVSVEVRLSPQEAQGGDGGVVAILTDRTELKRAEQEARRKERLASLGELSAGVAHEIRNPLAGIGASAQLLSERLTGEDHRRLTAMILDEVARLDRIVENLLEFAHPAQPNLRLHGLEDCVEKALALVEDEASRMGVEVKTNFPEDIPRVWIDPDQFEQVVLNLIRNALQAMDGKKGELRLTLRRAARPLYVRKKPGRRKEDQGLPVQPAAPQDWIELEIADTGHGVEPDTLERIFDPFYTTRKKGTGLGLSITQAIIQEHGGMISIHSEVGVGTTVLVDLPEDKRHRDRRATG